MSLKVALREPTATSRTTGPHSRQRADVEDRDATIRAVAELLRGHQAADLCTIVLADGHGERAKMYSSDPTYDGSNVASAESQFLLGGSQDVLAFPIGSSSMHSGELERIAKRLRVASFTSFPLLSGAYAGRIYIGWRTEADKSKQAPFDDLLKHVSAIITQTRALRGLATDVASEERRRISRDLHDSTIQPYIGLKIGLEALRRNVAGEKELSREVDELVNMTSEAIADLRDYVGTLKRAPRGRRQAVWLMPSVRRQAKKFSAFYGVKTRVIGPRDVLVTPAVHDEIINIVREGLSNIRRHTSATKATIQLRGAQNELRVEIINDNSQIRGCSDFVPRSIEERVLELGGRLTVERLRRRHTQVAVVLPL